MSSLFPPPLTCYRATKQGIPIVPVDNASYADFHQAAAKPVRQFLEALNFSGKAFESALIPDFKSGNLQSVLVGVNKNDPWALADLPKRLNAGHYYLDDRYHLLERKAALFGFGMGHYSFDRYKSKAWKSAASIAAGSDEIAELTLLVQTFAWVRNLINTPTEDLPPSALADEARELAKLHGAKFKETVGEALLKANYPAIYRVGRAATDAPRLVDFSWGNVKHPKLTLVGKGVCFDTGGLNLKPGDNMLTMRKDMGGAAHVLGLAHLIMALKLPVRLRVLLPIVENAIGSRAYRPGDIIKMRSGLSVEVNNTDAEGRLVLADALAEAVTEKPRLMIDLATLTGARSVALGNQIGMIFGNDDATVNALIKASKDTQDPLWPMPLYQPYLRMIMSKTADLSNSGPSLAGSITAALFLQSFVKDTPWLHMDFAAWNETSLPGRPEGAHVTGLLAFLQFIKDELTR